MLENAVQAAFDVEEVPAVASLLHDRQSVAASDPLFVELGSERLPE
jgi:hypothetical protein